MYLLIVVSGEKKCSFINSMVLFIIVYKYKIYNFINSMVFDQ